MIDVCLRFVSRRRPFCVYMSNKYFFIFFFFFCSLSFFIRSFDSIFFHGHFSNLNSFFCRNCFSSRFFFVVVVIFVLTLGKMYLFWFPTFETHWRINTDRPATTNQPTPRIDLKLDSYFSPIFIFFFFLLSTANDHHHSIE